VFDVISLYVCFLFLFPFFFLFKEKKSGLFVLVIGFVFA
jgi:hypothetical protein